MVHQGHVLRPMIHRHQASWWHVFIRSLAAGIFMVLLIPTMAHQARADTPIVFRSENYALHRVSQGETPGVLAKRYFGNEDAAWRIMDANPQADFAPETYVVVPLRDHNPGGLMPDGYQTIPILCYHRFGVTCRSQLCLPADVFEKQIAYLKKNGYRSVSLNMLSAFLQYQQALPSRSVIITIDDGYKSGYDIAYPILKKYGFTATFFVYIDFVGVSKNALDWHHLRQLKSDGFEIGSHTLSHADLSRQKPGETRRAYLKRIEVELIQSKAILDKKLNQDTRCIAWPFGRYNNDVLDISNLAGYTLGFSVKRGGNAFFDDPMVLRRDQVLSPNMKRFRTNLKTFVKAPLR